MCILNPEYTTAKCEAFRAADAVHQSDLVETVDTLLSEADSVSADRAREVMERLTYLLRCQEVCIKHKVIHEAWNKT